jgi:hypothetical protein
MATRVNKAGSAQKEFALAPQPLHIADLDTDLDAIFTSIDNTNIIPGAAIATSKIAQDGGIQAGHVAALAVTAPKLAVGAAINAISNGPVGLSISATVETLIVTVAGINTRGGSVLLFGAGGVRAVPDPAGPTAYTWRIKRDGATIATITTNLGTAAAAANNAYPWALPAWIDVAPVAGAHVYTVTAQTAAAAVFQTPAANAGSYFAVELA